MSAEWIDISPKKDGGVLKSIQKPGTGATRPSKGTSVKVHYVGTLENGEKFDSSRDRGTEFTFGLGQDQVIKGWDIGVASMTQGEIATFKISSDYGYGSAGSPPKIPGGATLIFEIELISWQAEDMSPEKDGSILRTIISDGEKLANPNDTSKVSVHVVGKHEGRVFYDKDMEYNLGEASEVGLPDGVDKALKRFCRGEKSIIELKGAKYTYGNNPPSEYNLPANASLEFTIFLKEFEKVPATWEMTGEQKIAAAKEAKEKGTQFLQSGKLKLAFAKYKRVEDLLEYEKTMDGDVKKERDVLILAAFLNMSLVASKMGEHVKAIKYCDKALEASPNNVKALFRKATSMLAMNDTNDAREVFEKVVELDPENKAAQQQILVCKQKIKDDNDADRKRFKKLFANMNEA